MKLGTLLVPGGAVVEAVRGVYNTVQFFLERGQQLGAVVTTFLDALGTIAAGGVAAAATRLEQTMGRLVPLVLAFLARLTGLGDISRPIQALLQQLRRPLEAALEKLVGIILKLGQRLLPGPVQGGKMPAVPIRVAPTVAGPVTTATAPKRAAGLRQPFTVGPEQHTLFFEGTANHPELMVASRKQSYRTFLRNVKKDIAAPDAAIKDAYRAAVDWARQIDEALAQSQRTPGLDVTATVSPLIVALVPHTMQLMQARGTGTVRGAFDLVFGGVTLPAGFGRAMHVTFAGNQIPDTGSAPSVADTSVYATLKLRKRGMGPYYVRGHLLSQALGGPGNTWENLTPLRGADNTAHEQTVERKLKDYRTQPKAFLYSVLPTYGRGVNEALIQQLHGPMPDPDAAVKEEIIRAEQFVPQNLVCAVWELEADNRRVKLAEWTLPLVANSIAQNSPADYQVGLLQRLRPVSINSGQADKLVSAGFEQAEVFTIAAAVKLNNSMAIRNRKQLFDLVGILVIQHRNGQLSRPVATELNGAIPQINMVRLNDLFNQKKISFAE